MSMPLTPAQWQRLEELYHAALAIPVAERAAWLDCACGDDTVLRQAIDELIDLDSRTAGFLDESPALLEFEALITLIKRTQWEDES